MRAQSSPSSSCVLRWRYTSWCASCTDNQSFSAQVYTVVEHLVYCNTSLLYGRHLDQLLLAATYGVCKVHGLKQVGLIP